MAVLRALGHFSKTLGVKVSSSTRILSHMPPIALPSHIQKAMGDGTKLVCHQNFVFYLVQPY